MRYWDNPDGKTLQIVATNRYAGNGQAIAGRIATAIAIVAIFAACEGPAAPDTTDTPIAASLAPVSFAQPCGQGSLLVTELYGGIRATIDWQEKDLSCTGMPRPDGEGARLRLSGQIGAGEDSRTLAFILGLPNLEFGQTGTELATNVTLIEEGTGRFFGTRDNGGCWTDVVAHESIGALEDGLYRIEGTLYCVSPLAELNGTASVTVTELKFIGRLNWEQPE